MENFTKEEVKEMTDGKTSQVFIVVKTGRSTMGEVQAQCITLDEARKEVKASKTKMIILKVTCKMVI